jgi:hypothetical protein
MKIKSSVYQSLISVLLLICVIVACTPINSQPRPLELEQKASVTQKATETQLPTLTPTPTETLTPTATETPSPTPTPTATPEPYPIDMEKLSNPPQSYEDFVNNLDKFVQAPSPDGSDENFQEFVTWYNETLFQKTLGGDLEALPVNYDIEMITISVDTLRAYNDNPQERHSLPYFFYFKDRTGVPYPCYVVTVATPEYQQTFTVVGRESTRQWRLLRGSPDLVTEVYQGINSFSALQLSFEESEYYSNIENHLINQGFGSFPSTVGEIPIIFGSINFNNK